MIGARYSLIEHLLVKPWVVAGEKRAILAKLTANGTAKTIPVPELPDLEVYVQALRPRLKGATLDAVRLGNAFFLRTVEPPLAAIMGQQVTALQRVGKRLALEFSSGHWLAMHLMIAGRLQWHAAPRALTRRHLAGFDFSTGTLLVTEAGTQRRAWLKIFADRTELSREDPGGIEPLTMSFGEFDGQLRKRNHTLKRALSHPGLFSGIGNAYSDEILHRARLSPVSHTQSLDAEARQRLYRATQATLTEWTRRLSTEAGEEFPKKVTAFRPGMAVHGRFGQPCPDCGSPIQRIRYASRETNYCARCQTGGRVLKDRALSRLLKADWPSRIEQWE